MPPMPAAKTDAGERPEPDKGQKIGISLAADSF